MLIGLTAVLPGTVKVECLCMCVHLHLGKCEGNKRPMSSSNTVTAYKQINTPHVLNLKTRTVFFFSCVVDKGRKVNMMIKSMISRNELLAFY